MLIILDGFSCTWDIPVENSLKAGWIIKAFLTDYFAAIDNEWESYFLYEWWINDLDNLDNMILSDLDYFIIF